MEKRSWTLEKDESIQCQQLTPEYLEQALDMMENAFFRYENVCKAIGLPEDPEAIKELKELTKAAAEDGVTVIAVDVKNNKVIGAAFNKLQVQDTSGGEPFFETFQKFCTQLRSQTILNFMLQIDNECNLFDLCQVNCILEIMFLGTLPEYRGKGIAKKLCEISIELGRELLKGNNIKISVHDGKTLSLEPVPEIVSAIFTSFITQRIGKLLGFRGAIERSYEEFEFEGKTFASLIGKETPTLTLEYKRLDK